MIRLSENFSIRKDSPKIILSENSPDKKFIVNVFLDYFLLQKKDIILQIFLLLTMLLIQEIITINLHQQNFIIPLEKIHLRCMQVY